MKRVNKQRQKQERNGNEAAGKERMGVLEKLGRQDLEVEEFLKDLPQEEKSREDPGESASKENHKESHRENHRGLIGPPDFTMLDKAKIWLQTNKVKIIGGFLGLIILVIGIRLLVSKGDGSGLAPAEIAPLAQDINPTSPTERELKAHIVGAVQIPDVYAFKSGERVVDLIEKAGGSLEGANPDALNLAMHLVDGQKICVPFFVQPGEENSDICASHKAGESGGKININLAGLAELDSLTGIGAERAQSIIEYREANGLFDSVDDLANISGISAATIDKFRDRVTV